MDAPVSVIIPVYNGKDVIERAIQSVYDQTWRPAELIVVDDGSIDGTVMKLRELKERYKGWLKVIELGKNSGGPSLPRNIGWENATQPYIALLDFDDVWHVRKIEIQLKFMLEHPEFVLTGHKVKTGKIDKLDFELPDKLTYKEISKTELLLRNVIMTSSVMVKKEISFRFDEKLFGTDDYFMWLSIIFSGYRIALINLPLGYYNFGEISSKLWKMEKNELSVYIRLMRKGWISRPTAYFLLLFSFLKYLKRVFVSLWRLRIKT